MLKSKTENRTLNRSKDSTKDLPRIQSQKRVQTATLQRKQSRQALSSRPISNNRQAKRALSTSNTCKTVRYEVTSALYAKKIEEVEKQNLILEMQLKNVQEQITSIRKQAMNKKRKQQFVQGDQLESEQESINKNNQNQNKVGYRKNINVNDPRSLKNQITIMERKIGVMRKKLDEQIEKNQGYRTKTDAVRKQIRTLKILNSTLLCSYSKTNQKFTEVSQLAKKLDEEISEKNELMNRIRIENMHKKGQIIKQYDNILRKLDKDLSDGNNNTKSRARTDNSQTNGFYMTQIGAIGQPESYNRTDQKKSDILRPSLTKSRKRNDKVMSNRIIGVRDHLQKLQSQFCYLNEHTGLKNADQITSSYMNKYQQNFKYYNYINDSLIKDLNEAQKQYEEAVAKRNEVIEELHTKNSEIKIEEILKVEANLEYIKNEKNRKNEENKDYVQYLKQVKEFVQQFFSRVDMKDIGINREQNQDITQQDIISILGAIQSKVSILRTRENDKQNYSQFRLTSFQQANLEDMLEATKRQSGQNDKSSRMMTREDFLKARDTLTTTKRNKSSRKTFSRK